MQAGVFPAAGEMTVPHVPNRMDWFLNLLYGTSEMHQGIPLTHDYCISICLTGEECPRFGDRSLDCAESGSQMEIAYDEGWCAAIVQLLAGVAKSRH